MFDTVLFDMIMLVRSSHTHTRTIPRTTIHYPSKPTTQPKWNTNIMQESVNRLCSSPSHCSMKLFVQSQNIPNWRCTESNQDGAWESILLPYKTGPQSPSHPPQHKRMVNKWIWMSLGRRHCIMHAHFWCLGPSVGLHQTGHLCWPSPHWKGLGIQSFLVLMLETTITGGDIVSAWLSSQVSGSPVKFKKKTLAVFLNSHCPSCIFFLKEEE